MKIAVLTDPESAAGYRLGGLEVALAHDPAEAREELARLVQTDEYALIIVEWSCCPTLTRPWRKRCAAVISRCCWQPRPPGGDRRRRRC